MIPLCDGLALLQQLADSPVRYWCPDADHQRMRTDPDYRAKHATEDGPSLGGTRRQFSCFRCGGSFSFLPAMGDDRSPGGEF